MGFFGKHRRAVRILRRVMGAGAILALVGLFLLAQRRPAWYVPVHLAADELPELRRELTTRIEEISRKMVDRKVFVVRWTERELTEQLAALHDLWPEVRRVWPAALTDPVVKVDDESILVAAFIERRGWRAIVGLRFAIDILGENAPTSARGGRRNGLVETRAARDTIRCRLVGGTVGSLSAPRWLLRRWLAPHLRRLRVGRAPDRDGIPSFDRTASLGAGDDAGVSRDPIQRIDGSTGEAAAPEDLIDELDLRNKFIWPNGKRRFRIAEFNADSGVVSITVEPM